MRSFPPRPEFVKKARLDAARLKALRDAAAADSSAFWARLAHTEINWQKPFSVVLDDSKAPNYRWFTDGTLNASWNCLDRHLEKRGDKVAIIGEGEKGEVRKLTYRQLHAEVCKLANGLKSLGVKKGDRVNIYLPMTPEAVIAMQACARIGAIHSVVFGGFSAQSLKDRIEDAGAKLLITADGSHRGGHIVELKKAADEALTGGSKTIEKVVVYQRVGADMGHDVPMKAGRD